MAKVDVEYILSRPYSTLELELLELLKKGELVRGEMVKILGIPRTTIYDALDALIVRGDVERNPIRSGERRRGRPKVLFSLVDGD